ncbi:MAG: DUF488 family protein [Chloroflexota bacterium]
MLYTIGHSNRSLSEFVAMLKAHGVEQLVDVRTAAGSRRNPQFMKDELDRALAAEAIQYTHLKGLGGFRKLAPDSVNMGWRNASFRGFADYMQTDDFRSALDDLLELAAERPTAIMCAEAVPWRCHRSLIADAISARGFPVSHIMSPARANPHTLTAFARVEDGRVTYPAET